LEPIEPFEQFVWLYLMIIPGVPFVLEAQGFYQRPLFAPRRQTAWILFKSCALTTIGVILVMFLFRITLARSVIVLFGATSFALVMANEELLRIGYRSRFGQLQLRKRVVLVGVKADTERIRADVEAQHHDALEILGELDLNEQSVEELVRVLHQ